MNLQQISSRPDKEFMSEICNAQVHKLFSVYIYHKACFSRSYRNETLQIKVIMFKSVAPKNAQKLQPVGQRWKIL